MIIVDDTAAGNEVLVVVPLVRRIVPERMVMQLAASGRPHIRSHGSGPVAKADQAGPGATNEECVASDGVNFFGDALRDAADPYK